LACGRTSITADPDAVSFDAVPLDAYPLDPCSLGALRGPLTRTLGQVVRPGLGPCLPNDRVPSRAITPLLGLFPNRLALQRPRALDVVSAIRVATGVGIAVPATPGKGPLRVGK